MAELVDASDSKSEDRKVVWVRFPPEAPLKKNQSPKNITGNRYLRRLAINNATERKDATMLKLLASLSLIITLGTAQGANAGPFEDGWAAYNRKDYATALSLWRPLAAQGNAWAQFNLGAIYAKRHGGRVFCLTSGLPPTRACPCSKIYPAMKSVCR